MLDFSKLAIPPDHGDVLVVPRPPRMVRAARENAAALRGCDIPLAGLPLREWRRLVRQRVAGTDDALIVVAGHQPSFVHAGVWAKHVVVARLAAAVDGVGMNLVVDSDAPQATVLTVPSVEDEGVVTRPVKYADLPPGRVFEQIPPQSREQWQSFERTARQELGELYDRSQMPVFFEAGAGAKGARDWVDQAVAGRRAIEARLGVVVEDRRISDVWWDPLLVDLLGNAERFRISYNEALAWYRNEFRVRGGQRPIPDLAKRGDASEVPVWAYRENDHRRRLFAERTAESVRLLVDDGEIGRLRIRDLASGDWGAGMGTGMDFIEEGWRLRPRVLTLTLWARLLLADLFVHGIGGAKYDRITDRIIADYYGLLAPQMACVSATLLLDLPRKDVSSATVSALEHVLHDLRFNPQRHLAVTPDTLPLLRRREAEVRRSRVLRASDPLNRSARRGAFDGIRAASRALLEARPDLVPAAEEHLARARRDLSHNDVALSREFFFGLHTSESLQLLTNALPDVGAFRV